MIQVSNEFKKAIKEPERRIKGYVEVLYDLPSVTITPIADFDSTYTNVNESVDGRRVENNYGTLDYLPLDGTRTIMGNAISANAGYISDDLFEDIESPVIDLNFASTTIKGVTLYFKDNYPTSLTLEFSDTTSINVQPDNEIVQVIFDEPKTVNSVTVIVNSMMYDDRKLKIQEIDLGVTQVYKDQDLIEFTVDEEVNKLVEEVPINETNIVLNNMTDLFNPLNPKGIVPYLSENTLIKPYIGVQTETRGVEYVKMGEFYFDSYTNNSDATTTLVGKNLIAKLEKELLKDNNETDIFTRNGLTKQSLENFFENYDYNFQIWGYTYLYNSLSLRYIKSTKLIDLLKDIAFYAGAILYSTRDSTLRFHQISFISAWNSLSKSELIKDVKYKEIKKIDNLKIRNPLITNIEIYENRDVYNGKIILNHAVEYILINISTPDFIWAIDHSNITVEQTGASSVSIISIGFYLCFLKIVGNIGSEVEIHIKNTEIARGEITEEYNFGKKENYKASLEFNTDLYNTYKNGENILKNMPSYEMSFEYNGDPSLEAGDYINVETPYGSKPLFIQKNRFKFDGGLTGSIEGVE